MILDISLAEDPGRGFLLVLYCPSSAEGIDYSLAAVFCCGLPGLRRKAGFCCKYGGCGTRLGTFIHYFTPEEIWQGLLMIFC